MTADLYDILDIPRDADDAAIRGAFRAKAKQAHPDAGGDADEFVAIRRAYAVLRDPDLRAHYDETGIVEEGRVKTDEEQVRDTLLGLFDNMLNQGIASAKSASVIHALREQIDQGLQNGRERDEKLRTEIKTPFEFKKTITRKGEEPNIFVRHVDQRMDLLDRQRKVIAHEMLILEKCLDELGNYSSFARAVRAMQVVTFGATTSTASTSGWA